jgi:hypothetical protein
MMNPMVPIYSTRPYPDVHISAGKASEAVMDVPQFKDPPRSNMNPVYALLGLVAALCIATLALTAVSAIGTVVLRHEHAAPHRVCGRTPRRGLESAASIAADA